MEINIKVLLAMENIMEKALISGIFLIEISMKL